MKHHLLPVSPRNVQWGYFSKKIAPALTLKSGDRATIETLTHHANDDYERNDRGDPGAESVFHWTREHKAIVRRGAGPTEGPFVRGSGEGVGVHLLTGPVAIENAEPGDILEVRILDVRPRPSCNACHAGRCFGSNAAASWGFHYRDLIEEPKPREVITIFELDTSGEPFAKAVYNYVWTPQTDPDGIVHSTIDYPGVRVDHTLVRKRENILPNVKVPARLHFGTMGLAPAESDFVSSIPPGYTGGNIDDWRIGKGARMYIRSRYQARFSRSAIRTRPRATANSADRDRNLADRRLRIHPAQEGRSWRHGAGGAHASDAGNRAAMVDVRLYVSELPSPSLVQTPRPMWRTIRCLDKAMRDAFRKLRRFLMTVHHMSEDEAIALMSVAAISALPRLSMLTGAFTNPSEEMFLCALEKTAVPAAEAQSPTLNCHNGGKPPIAALCLCWHERCFGLACQRWPTMSIHPLPANPTPKQTDRSLAGRVGGFGLRSQPMSPCMASMPRRCPGVFGRRSG